jgi:hypothetical protein
MGKFISPDAAGSARARLALNVLKKYSLQQMH